MIDAVYRAPHSIKVRISLEYGLELEPVDTV
jgi:hypothetical protein